MLFLKIVFYAKLVFYASTRLVFIPGTMLVV